MRDIVTAESLGLGHPFNLTGYLVDRHLATGRAEVPALVSGDRRLTYRELATSHAQAAAALREAGAGPGDRIAILLPSDIEFAEVFLGAMRIGAIPVPIGTLTSPATWGELFARMDARVIVVWGQLARAAQEALRASGSAGRTLVTVSDQDRTPAGAAAGAPDLTSLMERLPSGAALPGPAATSAGDVAFWLQSSGTTGRAKLVMHRHGDLPVVERTLVRAALGLTPEDRFLAVSKFSHAWGISSGLLIPLSLGATAVLSPGPPAPATLMSLVAHQRPTVFTSYPANYARILGYAGAPGVVATMDGVRLALSSGEPLPQALFTRFQEQFGVSLLDVVGSTELLTPFTYSVPGAVRPGSCGRPIPGIDVRFVPVPDGAGEELHVRSGAAFTAYWQDPARTAAVRPDEWVRTGDLYTSDDGGFLYFRGRRDDFFKVGAEWVCGHEVEAVLRQHEGVEDIGVGPRATADGVLRCCAHLVVRGGHDPATVVAALRELAAGVLPHPSQPTWYQVVTELPRTPTGKLRRHELAEQPGTLADTLA